MGRDSLWKGNIGGWLTPFLYQACTEWVVILLLAEKY